MSASSPNSWGEFIISRVPCSPHTQLSRPMSWGHHILESRTTQKTQHVCHAHRWCTVHREMLHRMLVGLRVYTRQHKCRRYASVLKRDSQMSKSCKNQVDVPKVNLAKWVVTLRKSLKTRWGDSIHRDAVKKHACKICSNPLSVTTWSWTW